MPLWQIYGPVGAFTAEDKKAIAGRLTDIYVEHGHLPRFYVNVLFHEVAEEDFLIGGEPRTNFVRCFADHIARHMEPGIRQAAMKLFESAFTPFVEERGLDWEIHIDLTPMDLWQIQGFTPPPEESDAERLWGRENRALEYDTL